MLTLLLVVKVIIFVVIFVLITILIIKGLYRMEDKVRENDDIEPITPNLKPRSKRIWINNGVKQRLLNIDDEIPVGYTKGRVTNKKEK